MERMKKGKESGTLLGVGTAYLQAKEIKGEFYVKVSDFNRCMDSIRIEQEADRKHIEQLEKENKMLHEEQGRLHRLWSKDTKHIAELEEENKKLNKKIEKLQIEIGGLMGERDGLQMVVERLHKEIEELEKPNPKFSDFGGYDE